MSNYPPVGLPIYQSHGMGVESTAIWLKWYEDKSSRNFEWNDLTVITAQTGDEHEDTQRLMMDHIFPRMRSVNCRYVQVARGGPIQEDGIVVLADTKQPTELFREGSYKLSDELKTAGTVPQFGGDHICALKFKSFVIDSWLKTELITYPFVHVFGYNRDEIGRIYKSQQAIATLNEQATGYTLVFGYNRDEVQRISKANKYDIPPRFGYYPLSKEVWNWTREDCFNYIKKITGIEWRRSACVYCPFNKITDASISRMRETPQQIAEALFIEFISLCMNPRTTLYNKRSLYSIVVKDSQHETLQKFESMLNATEWSIYRVRRIYTKKGKAIRAVEQLETGERDLIFNLFSIHTSGLNTANEMGITYAYRYNVKTDCYPTYEEFYVTCPSTVKTKARGGIQKFDEKWLKLFDASPNIVFKDQQMSFSF
jgi:hypothetical protein